MSRRKGKPKSPEQIAAERLARRALDFEAVALPAASAALPANDSIEVRRGGRRNLEGARRLDAFEALREGMAPGAFDAARRLERDLTIRAGEHDRGRTFERVDCETRTDRADAMIAAGQRVDAVLSRMGERDAWLLVELIRPSTAMALARPGWRAVVAHVTAETNDRAQAAVVRNICANLAAAYQAVDRRVA